MKPTTEQISQAERLQAKGLCQDVDVWIHQDNFDKTLFMAIHKSHSIKSLKSGWTKLGPLPTFEEVWRELLTTCGKKGWRGQISVETCLILIKQEFFKLKTYDNPTMAAIEALLYLSEGG